MVTPPAFTVVSSGLRPEKSPLPQQWSAWFPVAVDTDPDPRLGPSTDPVCRGRSCYGD